jgi:hypothetical protein
MNRDHEIVGLAMIIGGIVDHDPHPRSRRHDAGSGARATGCLRDAWPLHPRPGKRAHKAVREYRECQQRIRPAESAKDKAMREYRERQEEIRGCRYDAQLQGVCL